jgi:tRNA(Arg) A34 adenosine deaminase TadA
MPSRKKTWEELTPNQRKTELALDVIQHIHARSITMAQAGYISQKLQDVADYQKAGREIEKIEAEPLGRKSCRVIREHCTMCARGALLISRIDKFNHLTWDDIGGRARVGQWNTTVALDGAFSNYELLVIECAFERTRDFMGFLSAGKPHGRDAELFGKDHPDPDMRMLAIMQNIVDHDGDFVPSVRYEIQ